MGVKLVRNTPYRLWYDLVSLFLERGHDIVEDNSGVAHFIFNNTFIIRHWNTFAFFTSNKCFDTYRNLGYSVKKNCNPFLAFRTHKINSLFLHYIDDQKWKYFLSSISAYSSKRRFTLGYNFKSHPARSGGCLHSISIIRSKLGDEVIINTKIQEVPKKFFADLVLFNFLIRDIQGSLMDYLDRPDFHLIDFGSIRVRINNSSTYFWTITMPHCLITHDLSHLRNPILRRVLERDWKRRRIFISKDYKYKSQERVWKLVLEKVKEEKIDENFS
ncbi:MAG: hypothetical protein QXO70_03130 [Candidatus Pacearchaeota archaeon]